MQVLEGTIQKADDCLEEVRGRQCSLQELQDLSVRLVSLMLQASEQEISKEEKKQQKQMAAMMQEPHGKTFTFYMADQCFRSKNSKRVADQLVHLLVKFGVPSYLPPLRRFQLRLFKWVGKPFSSLVVPMMMWAMRKQTRSVIVPGESNKLASHIRSRNEMGIRMNLNHLGEAILGEKEAAERLQLYLDALANPDVEYVSIKISTIYSQINLLAWEETLEVLTGRLKLLYRAAMKHRFVCKDGREVAKFVNLDMEEYRDLHLTVALFKKVLEEEEFKGFSAGIVLQAYLPDSYQIQKELTAWGMERKAQGGAPIKIRIVKGANLAMERLEASLRGWPQAPFLEKIDVDANYKRMLLFGMEKEHAEAVHLGVGSHNLFDIAFGLLLRASNGVESSVCFEMLEGMAVHLSRVVQRLSGGMLLYCPAAKRDEFQNAVAYLVRRLDENTAEDHFLRDVFHLKEGSSAWKRQVALFSLGFERIPKASSSASRTQNRLEAPLMPPIDSPFRNEPDTDFSLQANRVWANEVLKTWASKEYPTIPIVIDAKEILSQEGVGIDPSNPDKKLYNYTLATAEHVELALQTADLAAKEEEMSVSQLSESMARLAHQMRVHRGDLIGAMIADGGKTFMEADVEVSEAIDMAEYYRRSREELQSHEDLNWTGKSVVVVVPPWNFPCAIPAGGIISALMAGNSVIFKPSRETVLVAWILVNLFWNAGISKRLLQFVTGASSIIGNQLISDPRVKTVILTGSTATAEKMLKIRPTLHLMAETGGKNAIIVTKLADRDLAIKEVVHSAFGHAGQKCSAASLLILEKEVYDDLHFQEQLCDAAASLIVGSAWNRSTKVNPLIHAPEQDLMRSLTTLDEGEAWLLKPVQNSKNRNLWSPGIKWGVTEGSFSHVTEFFGPVLSVMCAQDLEHAIHLANGTRYGLTSGLHSLDEREHQIYLEKIQAGNCYINRGITGAIVCRQPFGGCKDSSVGPGTKAGGPNYLIPLMHVEQKSLPKDRCSKEPALEPLENHLKVLDVDLEKWIASAESYAFWWKKYSQDSDPTALTGQDNLLRYRPHPQITLRLQSQDKMLDFAQVCAAIVTCKAHLYVSCNSKQIHWLKNLMWPELQGIEWIEEEEEVFLSRLRKKGIKRLRLLSKPSDQIIEAAASSLCYISQAPVLANGRVELLHYLREIAISIDYHRYGNLGERDLKK